MSTVRKPHHYKHQSSLAKPVMIFVVIALALGGLYYLVGNKKSGSNSAVAENENTESKSEIKSSGLNPKEKVSTVADVEKVMSKWIEANPEAILQSVSNMQQKAMEKQMNEAKKNIVNKLEDIYNHKIDPAIAPAGYDVAVVEFFDYNCGYCKRAQSTVDKLLQDDKKVKFIFKEYPILGQASEELSKVAIAVNIVDSNAYLKFHHALMRSNSKTKDDAIKVAKSVGVNVDKLKKTLDSKKSEIEEEIKFNRELGAAIGVNGTPAFIVGNELVSGAVEIDVLKAKLSAQREKK